ncbi:transcriptional regulator [Photobacterium jeanii]|uniref:Transcriptional regulator n=1 Tax=Photobacterium jeanii TaxID=858640 RepID=A0A178K6Y5_9GAMM|nr:AraC family transcriptional regulator [Photobacterium jeanii]OAN13098.1 transcriptional regulator [Photobacterium jeanii]PST89248.1 AraC family transcriptional regulator [Photobacterium jeanii]
MNSPHSEPVLISTQDSYSAESVSISPLSLFSSYDKVDVELRRPHDMPGYHWHGQVEVNIPFGGDVEYIVNGNPMVIKDGHIGLFWASVPHRLTDCGTCHNMGIINIPIHHFLAWPLNKELVNQITHGAVLQSNSPMLVSEFEIERWEKELTQAVVETSKTKTDKAETANTAKTVHFTGNESRQQLAADEISLMLKRLCFDGWHATLARSGEKPTQSGVSKHSQFYVSQMLEYIARHHDSPLTVNQIAEHVGLNPNYAMGIFQRMMQLTIKQYITAMRMNHAKALLSDTERTILDISLTVGFNSSSRFYQTFQTYLGVTPTQYRKLSRNDHRWAVKGTSPLQQLEKGACNGKQPVGFVMKE